MVLVLSRLQSFEGFARVLTFMTTLTKGLDQGVGAVPKPPKVGRIMAQYL